MAALCVHRLGRERCSLLLAPCHLFWRDAKLGVARRGSLREKTGEFRAMLGSCVSTWLAHQARQPHGLSMEGADAASAPLSGLGMIHRCGPCTSEIVKTTGGGPRKHSFFYTSSQGHVNCPSLPDCGQKTPASGRLVAQGLKKWHRDSEWQCSQPVLRHEVCSSAFSPFPSSLKGHVPGFSSQRPHRCYLSCWPRCGAAKLRLGLPKVSCMSISLVPSSAVICWF